jgi:hypothetical protein
VAISLATSNPRQRTLNPAAQFTNWQNKGTSRGGDEGELTREENEGGDGSETRHG